MREIAQDFADRLIQTLVEIADNPPEEDEVAINRIRSIIRGLIPVNQD
ncbi:hypothetical protein [Sulfurisphaera ohwakuensis]